MRMIQYEGDSLGISDRVRQDKISISIEVDRNLGILLEQQKLKNWIS